MASTLKVRITGDGSDLRAELDKSEGLLGGFSKKAAAFSVAAGNVLSAGVQTGASAAVSFLGDSIGAASDLGETVSKVGVLFGDAADDVEAFAAGSAKQIGQSRQQALDAAATFATFGKSAGLSGDKLVKFSTDFTSLASDMASFNNTTPEQAIEAIGAALRGEAEPIRQYGVLMDDAALRQAALKLGIISTTKEALTPQQKVLAAQQLIFEQTSAAQGDFARTSDGLANSQRILSAQTEDLKTKLGVALLPAMQAVTRWAIDSLVPALETRVIPAFMTVARWIGENVVPAVQTAWRWFDAHLLPVLAAIADFIGGTLVPAVAGVVEWLADKLGPIIREVAGFIRDKFNKTLGDTTSWFNDEIRPAIAQVIDKLRELWDRIDGFVIPIVEKLAKSYLAALKLQFEAVSTVLFGVVIPALRDFVGIVIEVAGWLVTAGIKAVEFGVAVGQGVADAIGWLRALPGRISDAVGNLGSTLYDAGASLMRGLLNGIKDAFKPVTDFVSGIAGTISNLKGPIPYDLKVLIPNGEALMSGLAAGMRRGLDDVTALASSVAPTIAVESDPGAALARAASPAAPAGQPIIVQLTLDRRVLAQTIVDTSRRSR